MNINTQLGFLLFASFITTLLIPFISSATYTIPIEHDGMLLYSEQRCGRSAVSYSAVTTSSGHIYRYEPSIVNSVANCSVGCECAGLFQTASLSYISVATDQHPRSEIYIQGCDKFRNIEDYITRAAHMGFKALLVNEKPNSLLTLISSVEARVGISNHSLIFNKLKNKQKNIIKIFQTQALAMIVSRLKAMALGLRVIDVNFRYDMNSNVCEVIHVLRSRMKTLRAISSSVYENLCRNKLTDCSPHPLISDNQTLSQRVGPEAAQLLVAALEGTAYEWMLDLKATVWPNPSVNDPFYSINPYYHISPSYVHKPLSSSNRKTPAYKLAESLVKQSRTIRCFCPFCSSREPSLPPSVPPTFSPTTPPTPLLDTIPTQPSSSPTPSCCCVGATECVPLVDENCGVQCGSEACKQHTGNVNCNCIKNCQGNTCSAGGGNPCGNYGTCCCASPLTGNPFVYGTACPSCSQQCSNNQCSTRYCDRPILPME